MKSRVEKEYDVTVDGSLGFRKSGTHIKHRLVRCLATEIGFSLADSYGIGYHDLLSSELYGFFYPIYVCAGGSPCRFSDLA